MRTCPAPGGCESPGFDLRTLLVVVVAVEIISGHPLPYWQYDSTYVPDGHPSHLHSYEAGRPYSGEAFDKKPPLVHQHDCKQSVITEFEEKPKIPQPYFLPFTYKVLIPWPTPFNGTHFAPVPQIPSTNLPCPTLPTDDSAYSLYIPIPEFEFIPFCSNTAPQPYPPAIKPETFKPNPAESLTIKSSTKQTPSKELYNPKTVEPSSKGKPSSTLITPVSTSEVPPSNRMNSEPVPSVEKSPSKLIKPDKTNESIDPIIDELGPSEPKPQPLKNPLVPLPSHTWVPPPDELAQRIPPSASILHPRSSVSHYEPKPYLPKPYHTAPYHPKPYQPKQYQPRPYYPKSFYYDYEPNHPDSYEPRYFHYKDYDYLSYNPGFIPMHNSYQSPHNTDPYYPEFFQFYPYRYPQHPPTDQTPYVTFGPDIVTFSPPNPDDSKDGYFIYGPNEVTFTEDSPAPFPSLSTHNKTGTVQPNLRPSSPSPKGTQPVIPTDQPSFTSKTSYSKAKEPQSISGRSSSISFPVEQPSGSLSKESSASLPRRASNDQPSIALSGRSSAFSPSTSPDNKPITIGASPSNTDEPQKETAYVLFDPEIFTITDDYDKHEKTIVYGPNQFHIREGDPFEVSNDPDKDNRQSMVKIYEEGPGYYVFTTPEEEFFEGTAVDIRQPLEKHPALSQYSSLLPEENDPRWIT